MSGSLIDIVETLENATNDVTYRVDDITDRIASQRDSIRDSFVSSFFAVIFPKNDNSNQGHAYCPEEITCISAGSEYSFLSDDVAPPTPPRSNIPAEKEPPTTPPRNNPPSVKL